MIQKWELILILVWVEYNYRGKSVPTKIIWRILKLEWFTAAHSSILAWRILWTEKLGGLQSMGSQRDRHDWATKQHSFCVIYATAFYWCSQWRVDYCLIRNKPTTKKIQVMGKCGPSVKISRGKGSNGYSKHKKWPQKVKSGGDLLIQLLRRNVCLEKFLESHF